jgi:20S proteasome alpha/beta subunit
MNPEPQEKLCTWRKRLEVRKEAAMTIALGVACHKGIIVAADTQIAIGSAAQKASKLYLFKGKSGAFAIALASNDVNATRTLINRIQRKLDTTDCADSVALETSVCAEMAAWSAAFTVGAPLPEMEIILSARLINHGARLFFCQPPATFLEHHDYVAAGTGAAVTDPLNTTLFGFTHYYTDVQAALRRVSYFMYRAKKDTITCGKSTYCGIVSWNCDEPIVVNHLDFEVAEKWASELDFLLHTSATLYLGGAEDHLKENAQGIAGNFESLASFRTVQFHDIYGQVITL